MKKLLALCLPAACLLLGSAKKPALPQTVEAHPERATFTLPAGAKPTALFNGKNLNGWYTFQRTHGKNNDVEHAVSVSKGVIHLNGPDFGYICTEKPYTNYHLRVVFRWGEQKYAPRLEAKRDSGILYHFPMDAEDRVWPTSTECQVQEGDCGDYFCVNGTWAESPNETIVRGKMRRIVRTADFEKPHGEWNTIEVICLDDRSWHYVNGHLVNQATKLTNSAGKILLQIEGAEVYYKTVELLPLK